MVAQACKGLWLSFGLTGHAWSFPCQTGAMVGHIAVAKPKPGLSGRVWMQVYRTPGTAAQPLFVFHYIDAACTFVQIITNPPPPPPLGQEPVFRVT